MVPVTNMRYAPTPPKQTCGKSWILFEEEKWTQSAQEFYFWFSILQESWVAKVVKDVFTNVQKFCLCSCRVFYKLVCSQLCGKYKVQQMVPICGPTAKSSRCVRRENWFSPKTLWRDPSLSISWEASLTVPLPSAGVVVFTHIMYHPNNSGLFEGVISFARFCPLLMWIRRASICAMERVAPTCNGGTTTSGAMQYWSALLARTAPPTVVPDSLTLQGGLCASASWWTRRGGGCWSRWWRYLWKLSKEVLEVRRLVWCRLPPLARILWHRVGVGGGLGRSRHCEVIPPPQSAPDSWPGSSSTLQLGPQRPFRCCLKRPGVKLFWPLPALPWWRGSGLLDLNISAVDEGGEGVKVSVYWEQVKEIEKSYQESGRFDFLVR